LTRTLGIIKSGLVSRSNETRAYIHLSKSATEAEELKMPLHTTSPHCTAIGRDIIHAKDFLIMAQAGCVFQGTVAGWIVCSLWPTWSILGRYIDVVYCCSFAAKETEKVTASLK
jgi:hypothetical protein